MEVVHAPHGHARLEGGAFLDIMALEPGSSSNELDVGRRSHTHSKHSCVRQLCEGKEQGGRGGMRRGQGCGYAGLNGAPGKQLCRGKGQKWKRQDSCAKGATHILKQTGLAAATEPMLGLPPLCQRCYRVLPSLPHTFPASGSTALNNRHTLTCNSHTYTSCSKVTRSETNKKVWPQGLEMSWTGACTAHSGEGTKEGKHGRGRCESLHICMLAHTPKPRCLRRGRLRLERPHGNVQQHLMPLRNR
eukprot:scaffold15213_cov21-Tisochrysis_lutea.AAC.1